MIPETSARQAIALAGQGQNVSEIARHLGHDRKTIRIYLNGHRAPGQPRPHADSFAPFAAYVRQRAADDPHLRSTGLHREAAALGYAGSYSAFTRELRGHGITAACGTCRKWKPIAPAQAREDCPGPLPFRTVPLGGETIASYLARVAAASHLPAGAITGCLPSMVRRPGRRLRRPRRHRPAAARRHQAPGRAHRDQRNRPAARAPRARRRRAPARPRDLRLPALRRPARAAQPCPRPHPRSPAGLPTAPHLDRPHHPDRHHHGPGHHRRQQESVPARPRVRHHQARTRRDHRPPGHHRRPGCPATRCGARPGQPRPRPRAPGHGRSSGLPRDSQSSGSAPPHARHAAQRAGIAVKILPEPPGGPTHMSQPNLHF